MQRIVVHGGLIYASSPCGVLKSVLCLESDRKMRAEIERCCKMDAYITAVEHVE